MHQENIHYLHNASVYHNITYIYTLHYTTHLCVTVYPHIKGQYSRILRQTLLVHYISPHHVFLVYRADVDVRHRDRGLALLCMCKCN